MRVPIIYYAVLLVALLALSCFDHVDQTTNMPANIEKYKRIVQFVNVTAGAIECGCVVIT